MGRSEFQARLARIGHDHARAARKQPKRPRHWPGLLVLFAGCCLGLVIGGFAPWAHMTLTGMAQTGASAEQLRDPSFDLVLAFMFAVILRQLTGWRSGPSFAGQGIGIAVAVSCLHLLVHRWPDRFAQLFSPDWVAYVQASTPPDTLLFLDALPS